MKKIRLGIVGLGQRGSSMLNVFLSFDCVDVVSVCDYYPDRVEKASKTVFEKRNVEPNKYTDFDLMLLNRNLDAIYVATSWEEHINQSIKGMQHHIPVAMEVGGAYSIKDCWRLVKAYEKTKTPIMLMENCCYDKFETLLFNLVKEAKFGEIIHCHGAYSHDLRKEISEGNIIRHYRLRNYLSRNCENYPTHELGPIAKLLNINTGNRLKTIVSISSKSKGLEEYIKEGKCPDKSLNGAKFAQGDIISTILTCENGETITLTLDTTLPGYYSRQIQLKGTKGCANQEANMILFDDDKKEELWHPYDSIKKFGNNAEKLKDYLPKYWRDITPKQIELGHGGMDYFMVATFIDCLLNGKEMPIDVYDAASWYSITPLSEKSIKTGKIYMIPDFTKGAYKNRKHKDLFENDRKY